MLHGCHLQHQQAKDCILSRTVLTQQKELSEVVAQTEKTREALTRFLRCAVGLSFALSLTVQIRATLDQSLGNFVW